MHGDWFYTTGYGIFGHEVKATKRSPPDSLTRWIIIQSKGFTRKGIEKIRRSVRTYIYLILISQVQARSSIVGNSGPTMDARQVFKSTFKELINEDDYSIANDISHYQGVLEYALSKADFSVGMSIYMLLSNLNLNIGKKKGYNNKILKIGSNRDINKNHKKLPSDKSKKTVAPAVQHDLIEKHNDEKLAITFMIVGAGLIAYYIW